MSAREKIIKGIFKNVKDKSKASDMVGGLYSSVKEGVKESADKLNKYAGKKIKEGVEKVESIKNRKKKPEAPKESTSRALTVIPPKKKKGVIDSKKASLIGATAVGGAVAAGALDDDEYIDIKEIRAKDPSELTAAERKLLRLMEK